MAPLDDLLDIEGVAAAGEFTPDGQLVDYGNSTFGFFARVTDSKGFNGSRRGVFLILKQQFRGKG